MWHRHVHNQPLQPAPATLDSSFIIMSDYQVYIAHEVYGAPSSSHYSQRMQTPY
ncbi:hypothetical protein Scep_016953 [Stephania cephalantha]|uniref:Uncharacterized protein n=1 Tax=Stephania cephalantha TaxID=152367 RepID=A0AAP0IPJ6_9MAGN